jgi:hypothetical protein
MANLCPVCGKDDTIQRVEAVVQAGQSSGTYSGPSGGVTYSDGKWGSAGGFTTLSGSTTSNLATLLALPSKPTKETGGFQTGCGAILVFAALVFGTTIGLTLLTQSGVAAILATIALLIFGVLVYGVPGVILLRIGARKKRSGDENYPHATEIWEKAKERWQRLYFCHRDGMVFDPENNKTSPPTQIVEFLYE